jgi:5-methylcytosine-specific restriction endonuclease McrA
MNVTKQDRETVYERDQYRCAACSNPSNLEIQHRINRGMGGDPTGALNRLSNLLTLCHTCNAALEADADFAEKGRTNGWKLSRWQVPTWWPVFYSWADEWRRLDDEGTFDVNEEVVF